MKLTTVCEVQLQDGSSFPLYRLQPKQLEAFQLTPLARRPDEHCPANIGYGGAAGGGKSYLARAVGTTAALQWPGSTGVIFRETEDDVKANHVNQFKDEVPDVLPDGRRLYSYNGQEMCATFVNGSRIYFSYLKEFDDVRRHQGREYDWMIFEESTHYTFEMVRWLVGNRLRATVDGARTFALYPSNPGNRGHHWYKRLFIQRKYYEDYDERPEDYEFVQAKVEDNELLLDRDPAYLRKLNSLPEPHRSWMRDGDWDEGEGLALPMLDRSRHLIESFRPPGHWTFYGSFDWGYAHPYSFGVYAVNEDRRHFKLDTITGRMQQPHDIAATVTLRLQKLGLSMAKLRFVYAGHDCWADHKARGEDVPTIAERLGQWGWKLLPANISRVSGLNNLRTFLSWKGVFPDGTDDMPYLMFMNTEGNRKCLECLESLPTDPDNIEDALKVDADSFGRGGDDMYDECLRGDTLVETERGPVAVADLVGTEGRVWTHRGRLRSYRHARQTGEATLFRITLADGRTVELTGGHPVRSAGKWKPARELRPGDDWDGFDRVSGPHLPAAADRLLPLSAAVPPPRRLRGAQRPDPRRLRGAPHRRRSGEQRAGEPRDPDARGAHGCHVDARGTRGRTGTDGASARGEPGDPREGRGVAWLGGGTRVALEDREGDLGERGVPRVHVRAVRGSVREPGPASAGEVLLQPLQSTCVACEETGRAPVYNLSVDEDESYLIAGGLAVHNCRYAMAGRAMPARSQYSPTESGAFSRAAIRQEHERQMKSTTPPMPSDHRYVEHPEFGVYT